MLNFYKFFEIVAILQLLVISTMLPVYISLPPTANSIYSLEMPISLQMPSIILLTLIFNKNVVYKSFSIYLLLGLFIVPVFNHGGSLGYLLTPNFGYLLGIYPLIKIIDNLNKRNTINIRNFLKNGFMAISAMHLTGILYNFIQILYYKDINIFIYNLGKYTVGKISYHLIILIPLILFIKPINFMKNSR